MELSIYKSPKLCKVYYGTRSDSVLIYGNPDHFTGPTACTEEYRGHHTMNQKDLVTLGIGHWPPCLYGIYISPVAENTLGPAVLTGAQLHTTQGDSGGEFTW